MEYKSPFRDSHRTAVTEHDLLGRIDHMPISGRFWGGTRHYGSSYCFLSGSTSTRAATCNRSTQVLMPIVRINATNRKLAATLSVACQPNRIEASASAWAKASYGKHSAAAAAHSEAARFPLLRRRPPLRIHSKVADLKVARNQVDCNASTIQSTGSKGMPIVRRDRPWQSRPRPRLQHYTRVPGSTDARWPAPALSDSDPVAIICAPAGPASLAVAADVRLTRKSGSQATLPGRALRWVAPSVLLDHSGAGAPAD